jgi:hypothetical protein
VIHALISHVEGLVDGETLGMTGRAVGEDYEFTARREATVSLTAKDKRLCVEAVCSRYRTGIPWSDQPARFSVGLTMWRVHATALLL